jgi:hypothetical protein
MSVRLVVRVSDAKLGLRSRNQILGSVMTDELQVIMLVLLSSIITTFNCDRGCICNVELENPLVVSQGGKKIV